MAKKNVIFLTLLLFIGLLPFYLTKLSSPNIQVWDEQYHVPAAQSYLKGEKSEYRNLRNPPLGKEWIALSIYLGGDDFFAYRLPSAIAASTLGALLFLTGSWLTGRRLGGVLALSLWLSSTLAFLHARLAMLDMTLSLFFIAGIAAFLPVLRNPDRNTAGRWIYLACLLAALGAAIKVLAFLLFPLFFVGLIAIHRELPLRWSLPRLVFGGGLACLLVLLVSYGLLGFRPTEIPGQLLLMFRLQSALHRDFSGLSPWYDWFLWKGHLWYRSELDAEGRRFAALCIQNPILWILGSLASIFVLIRGLRGHAVELILGLSIPAQIAFWACFKEQTILSYALPMEPIFCLNTALALGEWARQGSKPKWFYPAWAATIAIAAGFFFWKMLPKVLGEFHG